MIYCTDGEFHHDMHVGVGGWCARVYRTEAGARAVRGGTVVVQRIDRGVPVGVAS